MTQPSIKICLTRLFFYYLYQQLLTYLAQISRSGSFDISTNYIYCTIDNNRYVLALIK